MTDDLIIDDLRDFLHDAEADAMGRAADVFSDSGLMREVASSEIDLIDKLQVLIEHDEQTRRFVQYWRDLVGSVPADEFPRRQGLSLPTQAPLVRFTLGQPSLDAPVTLWDALVRHDLIRAYRTLGQLDDDPPA
jgi:hypothetical protein